jgi:galactokinase
MRLTATAPGRICLFGEHQDYLGLPVIAAAIGVEMKIALTTEHDCLNRYRLILHDLDHDEIINMAMPITYRHRKDYLRAVIRVLKNEGVALPQALTAEVKSTIPMQAGTSSSSALAVAWVAALLKSTNHPWSDDRTKVADLAHRAEVIEFRESGGLMDQTTIAFGGLVHFHSGGDRTVTPLPARPKGFVLGDSREPKDTQAILSRVRGAAENAIAAVRKVEPAFSLESATIEETSRLIEKTGLDETGKSALLGNVENRDILRAAHDLLSTEEPDPARLGRLLDRHHEILRDNLGISTPRIERMLDAARKAGALGGKINGSGGGGCMFALAPGRTAEVAAAIEKAGGKAYAVEITRGVHTSVTPGL